MKNFSVLLTLLDFYDELESYALVSEELYAALDELIYRVLEFDYNRMVEERA